MREMKDSGVKSIGKIPTCWCTRKFKTLAKLCNGREVSSDEGTIPVYGSGGIFKYTDKPLYSGESLLLGRKGTIDNPMIVDGEFWTVDTMFYTSAFQNVLGKYMYYCFKGAVDYGFYKSGSVLPSMTQTEINGISLPYPSLPEQRRIADYLDIACGKVDALIANQQAQIEKLKAYKQSLITEVVTHGLDPDAPMKDSGVEWIGQIPEGWEVSRVGLHYNIILGKMLCPSQINKTYTLEPYFCAANVHFGDVNMDELKEMWFSPEEKQTYKVLMGDMLIVEGGAGAGGCAIIEKSTGALVQNSIMIVRSKSQADNRYLRYWIESLVKRKYLDVVCNKATIPHFTKEKLARTVMPLNSFAEQQQIADYLDSKCAKIDALIAIKQKKIEKLTEYKKSLIYEYVTGKKSPPQRLALSEGEPY